MMTYDVFAEKNNFTFTFTTLQQQVGHLLLAVEILMVELGGFASLLLYTLNC